MIRATRRGGLHRVSPDLLLFGCMMPRIVRSMPWRLLWWRLLEILLTDKVVGQSSQPVVQYIVVPDADGV